MKTIFFALIGAVLSITAAFAEPVKMPADVVLASAAEGEVLLIDIRTPDEWDQSGVAAPAHLIDMQNKGFVRDLKALMAAHPGKPVAMICATGARSGFVTKRLAEYGFTGLIDVSEGMYGSAAGPGWLKRGLPVRKSAEPPTR